MEEQTISDASETPPPMPAVWFVIVNNEKKGPLTILEISQIGAEGSIDRRTLVWKKGMSEWLPIDQVPELSAFLSNRIDSTLNRLSGAAGRSPILDASKRSSQDAFNAFKSFIINPLSGLPATYHTLGKTGALSVSIVFIVAYELLTFFGLGVFDWPSTSIDNYLKLLVAFAVPYGGVMLSLLLIRMIRKAPETWHADLYVASSAALLGGIGIALAGLMGTINVEFVVILALIELCLLVYILQSGLERIYQYSETFTIWMIPVIIVFCVWLTKMIIASFLGDYIHRLLPFL